MAAALQPKATKTSTRKAVLKGGPVPKVKPAGLTTRVGGAKRAKPAAPVKMAAAVALPMQPVRRRNQGAERFSGHWQSVIDDAQKGQFAAILRMDQLLSISLIKEGAPAKLFKLMAAKLQISLEQLAQLLGIGKSTIARKTQQDVPLSADETSRLLGTARIVGQVQQIVSESGDANGFDAAQWVSRWIEQPLPALGGRRPSEFLDTAEGQQVVGSLIARMQTGAYS